MKLLPYSMVLIAYVLSSFSASLAADPELYEIIAKINGAYEKAATYFDQGKTRSVTIDKGQRDTSVKYFSTAFVRPNRFTMISKKHSSDFTKPDKIIVRRGTKVKVWSKHWGRYKLQQVIEMALALGPPHGMIVVPTLLMPDILDHPTHVAKLGQKLTDLSDARLTVRKNGDFEIEGLLFKKKQFQVRTKITVDSRNFLIKKLQTYDHFKYKQYDVKYEYTTIYEPKVNVDIDEKFLRIFDVTLLGEGRF